MKICVYCSSCAGLPQELYSAAEAFGLALAQRGHSLVYGGYGQGLMGATARGAAAGGAEITAVVPAIFDTGTFAAPCCTRVLHVGTMSERKARMEAEADAFAVLPGGIGTFDEFFEALVLKSLGQLRKPMAVYDINGSMAPLSALLKSSAASGFLKPELLALAPFFASGPELLAYLEQNA